MKLVVAVLIVVLLAHALRVAVEHGWVAGLGYAVVTAVVVGLIYIAMGVVE